MGGGQSVINIMKKIGVFDLYKQKIIVFDLYFNYLLCLW